MSEVLSGKEIIGATQDAVIEARDKVEQQIINIAKHDEHHEVFYQTPEFWTAMAFVLVVVLLYMPIKKVMISMFSKRRDKIIKRIDEASDLKVEARNLLAEYEQKLDSLDADTAEILSKSKKEIASFRSKSLREIEKQISNQERLIDERISNIKNKASEEVAELVAFKTITAIKSAIVANLTDKEKLKLIDSSIDYIGKLG